MKKTLSIFGMLMVFSSVSFAGGIDDPSSTKVAVSQKNKVIKVFCKSESRNVKVSIKNSDGVTVFSETVHNKNGFIRPYNLSSLNDGEYTVHLEDENGVREELVKIEKAKPQMMSAIIKIRDAKQCAILLSGKNDAKAVVSVKDQSDRVLQESEYQADGNSTRLIDLTKFKEPVTVEVKGNDGTVVTRRID